MSREFKLPLPAASRLATSCDWAAASAVSAARRAVVPSALVVTEVRSRRETARNATTITSVTESMMSVMTRAMPED